MSWIYKNTVFTTAPEDCEGFVYVIHNVFTKRYYIGQKRFWSVKKLPPLKGKVNKRHKTVETNWKDYWGSSEALHSALESEGKNRYTRIILRLCATKGDLNYYEAKEQFDRAVLLDPLSFNGIINCKIHRNHLSKKG
tara:strand:+ start:295 stop:705 length:411 start_codon:yes stop_codon:yes gene_type:complete